MLIGRCHIKDFKIILNFEQIMDNSNETTSYTESSPLLDESSTPAINDRERRTHPKTSILAFPVFCILFTEFCERLTFYSISGNLVYFATRDDHLSMTTYNATVLAFVFQGACYILPIFGGWLADAMAGKFTVIFLSAVVYLLGTLFILLGSVTRNNDSKKMSQCAAENVMTSLTFMRTFYIAGLFLVAFGTGGIKANVILFGAEQVSNRGPAAIQTFFNWFCWFIGVGALLAFTIVVYIQQHICFFYGNLIPPCSLILALIIFRRGKRNYILHPPAGSVLADILNIMKEAIKKSRRPSPSSSIIDHWLDRAKLCFGGSYSSWEVEDVKKVCRLLPIFGSFVIYWTVYFQIVTSMLYQGEHMNNEKIGFHFPIASLALFSIVGGLVLIPIMDKLVYPLLAKFEVRPSQLQRIGFGMIIATASMACAGGLEWYRVKQCCVYQHRPDEDNENGTEVSNVTILYQVPQYTLIGFSKVFTAVTGFELVYTEAPKYLQGVIMGVFLLTTGVGACVAAVLVVTVNAITGAVNGVDGKWYPDEEHVNKPDHLANYFFLLAVLMFLNFIVYIFVALSFKEKKESARRANMNNGVMNNGEPTELSRENAHDDGDWTSGRSVSGYSTSLVMQH